MIAAAESGFVLVIFVTSWRRIIAALRGVVRTPYVVLCCTYTVLFVYGFSAFSNAGNAGLGRSRGESGFILAIFVTSWRRIVQALRAVVRTPYVVLCCTYTVLFVYGFSVFSNAGILVRQRVQVLPFVLVLVCVPEFLRDHRHSRMCWSSRHFTTLRGDIEAVMLSLGGIWRPRDDLTRQRLAPEQECL